MTSTEAKLLTCDICSKKFKFSSTYKIHINKHKKHKHLLTVDNSQALDDFEVAGSRRELNNATKRSSSNEEQGSKKGEVMTGSDHELNDTTNLIRTCNEQSAKPVEMEVDIGSHSAQIKKDKTSREMSRQVNKDGEEGELSRKTTSKSRKRTKTKMSKIFACKTCKKVFSSKHSLLRHKNAHLDIRYECDQCKLSYSSKYSLKTHKMWHKNMKPWECGICGAQFLQNGHYRRHLKIHSDKKDQVCEQCGKRFRDKDALRSHKQTHMDSLTFECSLCSVKLKLRSSLRNHMKLHESQKEFSCGICHRSFTQKKTYLSHMRLHESNCGERKAYIQPIKEFCELCHKGFAKNSSLQKHMRKHELGLLKRFNSMKLQETKKNIPENVIKPSEIIAEKQLSECTITCPRNSLKTFLQVTSDKDMESMIRSGLQSVAHFHHKGVSFPSLSNADTSEGFVARNKIESQTGSSRNNPELTTSIDNNFCINSRQEFVKYTNSSSANVNKSDHLSPDSSVETRNLTIETCGSFTPESTKAKNMIDISTEIDLVKGYHVDDALTTRMENNPLEEHFPLMNDEHIEGSKDIHCNEKEVLELDLTNGTETYRNSVKYDTDNEDHQEDTLCENFKQKVSAEEDQETVTKMTKQCYDRETKRENIEEIEVITENEQCEENLFTEFNAKRRKAKALCEYCGEIFSQKHCMYKHLRQKTCIKLFQGNLCNNSFQTKAPDRSNQEKEQNIRYLCGICNKSYVSHFKLKKHLKHHVKGSTCICLPKIYACNLCDKTYTASSTLKQHLLKHKGVKFNCLKCSAVFSQKSLLRRHTSSVHEGVKSFRCEMEGCSKAFVDSRSLEIHIRTHTGEKLHQCEQCGKCFSDPGNLNVHQKRHQNIKEYRCDICLQEFSTKMSMLRHAKRHLLQTDIGSNSNTKREVKKMAEKTIICGNGCDKRFTTKRAMIAHKSKHCSNRSKS